MRRPWTRAHAAAVQGGKVLKIQAILAPLRPGPGYGSIRNLMEILPGIGLDTLQFGMTKSEVFERLGFPSKSYLTEWGDREVQYFTLKLVLRFEQQDDGRLGRIEVLDRNSTMLGISPWRMPRSELVALLTGAFGEESERDDYGGFESVTFWDHSVELQYAFGELSRINVGLRYGDDDEPIWPVRV
ncbi:MAG TPA: hypothetical protein VJ724_02940 [Tahibacter sp.]|nr:hypothetical protein [Tahibacter sp.]